MSYQGPSGGPVNDETTIYRELLAENRVLRQKIEELENGKEDSHLIEEGLRFSRRQIHSLIDSGPDFFFLKDLDLRYQLVNDANARFFGRDKADILGRTDAELMPEEAAVACQKSDRQAIREKKTVITIEAVGDRFYETYKSPVTVSDEIIGVAGVVRDITERRRAEEALRQIQARYRLLFEHAPDGVVIVDPATAQFLEFNEAAHRQLGYSREEFARLSIFDIDAVERPEETLRHIENIISKGRDDFETLQRTRQGEIRNVHVTAQMTEVSGHSVYHCVWRDVTERRRAEEALRESKEKYRELVENANSIILRMDSTGVVTFFNEFSQRFFGYTEEEILGKNVIGTIVPPTDSLGVDLRKLIRDIGKNPDRYPTNINENMRRDGERVWIAWTNKPVFDDRGRLIHILCIGNDITVEKKTAEELKRREHDLEIKSKNLEEAYTALKVVLQHKEDDREDFEKAILANVREFVLPYLDKLEGSRPTETQKLYIDIVRSNLNELISPFLQKMSAVEFQLTPTECQVAHLLKAGRSSKEIASALNIGKGTVETHRKNIRGKLGLSKKKINLQSYLRSLT